MNILRISFITMLIFCLPTSSDAQEAIDDFRGLKWGTSIDEAKKMMDLTEQQKNGKVTIYASPNDEHQIGSVDLREIYYAFHDDAGFYKVVFSGDAKGNEEMDGILKNRLGKKYEHIVNPSHTHSIWVVDDVTLVYKQQLSEDFTVSIRSEAIAEYQASLNMNIDDF